MSFFTSDFILQFFSLFFFNDTATTEIYTLSLHDALPICLPDIGASDATPFAELYTPEVVTPAPVLLSMPGEDRKSTRLNSSHPSISYAVFCLKKKKKIANNIRYTLVKIHYRTCTPSYLRS